MLIILIGFLEVLLACHKGELLTVVCIALFSDHPEMLICRARGKAAQNFYLAQGGSRKNP